MVDADGLNRIHPTWLKDRAGPTWITPHAGEFGRLWPELAGEPPLEAATEAAKSCGATVLLKGARSVIAAADGRRWQLMHACGETARAGLGDGLAGFAAGLGARLSAMEGYGLDASALAIAGLNHAIAGFRSKRKFGQGGATPLVVAEALGHGQFR